MRREELLALTPEEFEAWIGAQAEHLCGDRDA